MKVKTRKKPREYHRGYRREILELALMSGAISYRSLELLNGNYRIYVRRIREMCDEGILSQYRLGKEYAVRLKNFESAKKKYINVFPENYYDYYKTYCEDDVKFLSEYKNKENKTKAIKACRQGEVVAMMKASGIETRPEMKPSIASEEKIKNDKGYYFCSREIKEEGNFRVGEITNKKWNMKTKVKLNSRMMGGIVSPGGSYIVYHSGDALMRIEKQGETVMMSHMAKFVNRRCIAPEQTDEGRIKRCIVFGYTPEVFERIVSDEEKKRTDMSVSGYAEMYAIPYSAEGTKLLNLMSKANWKKTILKIVFGNDCKEQGSEMIYDEKDGSIKKLLFCIPDLCKLKKFINTAEWSEEPQLYHIYCFDFQVPFVKMATNGKAEIYSINFNDFLHILELEENRQDEVICDCCAK